MRHDHASLDFTPCCCKHCQKTPRLKIHTASSINNTLYSGDRAGSRYYLVMENQLADVSSNFTSGRFNPLFRDKVTAFVVNPFAKLYGFELFGNIEQAMGRSHLETKDRTWTQTAVDLLYRFGKEENFYLAARYNQVNGELIVTQNNVSIERVQASMGWFVTRNILAKVEYVQQRYYSFQPASIFHKGRFSGIILEGAIAF